MSLGIPASVATPLGRFRIVAFWEGVSFLLLLFVAMPLKYGLGIDMAVRVIGMAHGVLFIVYVVALGLAAPVLGVGRAILAFVLSLVPCGTFGSKPGCGVTSARSNADPPLAQSIARSGVASSGGRRWWAHLAFHGHGPIILGNRIEDRMDILESVRLLARAERIANVAECQVTDAWRASQ